MSRPFGPAMGRTSARIHGARNALLQWAATTRTEAVRDDISPELAAALRGKATAYAEAARLLESIERGWRLPRRWRG